MALRQIHYLELQLKCQTILIAQLHSQFSLKDLGTLHYFLDFQVQTWCYGGLLLMQSKYIKDVLAHAIMTDSIKTAMISGRKLKQVW